LNVLATKTERVAVPDRGACFFRANGTVMFEFVIDPTNKVGPRAASKADSEKHPQAWAAFATGETAEEPEVPEATARSFVEPKDMDGFASRLGEPPQTPVREALGKIERRARRGKA